LVLAHLRAKTLFAIRRSWSAKVRGAMQAHVSAVGEGKTMNNKSIEAMAIAKRRKALVVLRLRSFGPRKCRCLMSFYGCGEGEQPYRSRKLQSQVAEMQP
jgi:hypothetical protein